MKNDGAPFETVQITMAKVAARYNIPLAQLSVATANLMDHVVTELVRSVATIPLDTVISRPSTWVDAFIVEHEGKGIAGHIARLIRGLRGGVDYDEWEARAVMPDWTADMDLHLDPYFKRTVEGERRYGQVVIPKKPLTDDEFRKYL